MSTVQITYRPGEGDPASTVWNGFKFKANEARDIPEDAVVAHEKHPVRMVDLARDNPHFEIGGAGGKRKDPKAKAEPKQPKTSEDYRAHAVAWIKAADSLDALVARWNDETDLRELCGVGEEDVNFLQTFYAPRHDQLRREKLAAQR